MALAITLLGTNFGTRGLPQGSPYMFNGFVGDGLLFAMLPRDSYASVADISGKLVTITQAGTPIYPDGTERADSVAGVKGNFANGFRLDLAEPSSLTMVSVARVHRNFTPDNSGTSSAVACLLVNSYYGSAKGGGQILNGFSAGNDVDHVKLRVVAIDTMILNTAGSPANRQVVFYPDKEYDKANYTVSDWMFVCGVIDARNHRIGGYVKSGEVQLSTFYDNTSSSNSIPVGGLASRPLGQKMNIFVPPADSSWSTGGVAEMAACGIWNRALSDAEIQHQYLKLRELLYVRQGIAI